MAGGPGATPRERSALSIGRALDSRYAGRMGLRSIVLSSIIAWLTCCQAAEVEGPNYILGTQAIGGKYQFTSEHPLIESARVILEMGATTMKFALGRGGYDDPGSNSLATLAKENPAYRKVFDLPFAHYQIWANAAQEANWKDGLSPLHSAHEYQELYDLTAYLLTAYSGTGKQFFLGHWEGDNMLRGDISTDGDAKMSPTRVQGFIDWLQVRQRAVDDAKRDTPHANVEVWHYTEVNHPTISLRGDRPTLTNRVLPHVAVDFVSYSAYDASDDPEILKASLDYIESKLAPKPAISGKRVFIGEYGFKTFDAGQVFNTPERQNERCLAVIQAGLEWGCPFILYWELYNNEIDAAGKHRGFWMIDHRGVPQPVYETHRAYYAWARQLTESVAKKTGKPPSLDEFRVAAIEYISRYRSGLRPVPPGARPDGSQRN